MSVDLYYEIWNELKRHINVVDRQEAAETLVSVLIDNDVDADDIKSSFKSDTEVKRALTSYLKDHPADANDDDYEDDEDDDYDDSDEDEEDY
jgi:hypothetical protein